MPFPGGPHVVLLHLPKRLPNGFICDKYPIIIASKKSGMFLNKKPFLKSCR